MTIRENGAKHFKKASDGMRTGLKKGLDIGSDTISRGFQKGLAHGSDGVQRISNALGVAVDGVDMSTPAEAIVAGSIMSAIGSFLVTLDLKVFVEILTIFIASMASSYILHSAFLPPIAKYNIPPQARYFLCIFTVILFISITGSSNANGFQEGDTRMSMMGMGKKSGGTLISIIAFAVVLAYIVRYVGPVQSRWPLRYLSSITSLIAFLIFFVLRPYESDIEPCGASLMDRF
jgi:hypothetical protein